MSHYLYWYGLTHHTLDQGYIGVTKNPTRRKYEHNKDTRNGSQLHFHKALRKYGDELEYRILCYGEREYIYELEGKLRPRYNMGWNIKAGGRYSNGWLGKTHTEESKEKMRGPRGPVGKGIPKTEEHKKKLSEAHSGKVLTQEHKDNIGKANLGEKNCMFKGYYVCNGVEYVTAREAGEALGVSDSCIRHRCRNPKNVDFIFEPIVSES